MVIGVYVDDIILAHKGVDLNDFIKTFTGPDGFNAKHLGKLNWFLGMAIDQHDNGHISIKQDLYIKKLVEKFATKRIEKRSYPCKPHTFQKLRPAETDLEREKASRLPYLQLIGSLLYLSTMTRPDIAYHMSILCSLMHDPTKEAYEAALDFLMYIHTTSHLHISFTGSRDPPLGVSRDVHPSVMRSSGMLAYSDASWNKPDKLGFNMFGYVVYVYGGPVSFAAKRLKVVVTSSAEAEYAAAANTCKEVMFVRSLCDFLGIPVAGPSVLAVDNDAAIKIAQNMGVTARNKHFQEALHYFRHLCDHQYVLPTFVTTKNQRADGFTKALDGNTFKVWQKYVVSE